MGELLRHSLEEQDLVARVHPKLQVGRYGCRVDRRPREADSCSRLLASVPDRSQQGHADPLGWRSGRAQKAARYQMWSRTIAPAMAAIRPSSSAT